MATLPEGEDPDTIVQRGGREALEGVLKDAVDLLERKIQILDRKGLFTSLPGRRRALDRLLPTIRATQDPITRELYLSRTAEVATVRKDVLEREVAIGGTRDEGRGTGETVPSASPPDRPTALPSGAEKALLLLLLEGEPWKARVTETVRAEDIECAAYRAVFEAAAADAPERLDDTAARVYEQLKAEGLGERAPDELFERAVNRIEARRLEREIDRLDGMIPLATPEQQPALLAEKRRVFDALRVKYPRYKITARRRGASGT